MIITATGWSRTMVKHTLIETRSNAVDLGSDGIVRITGKSKLLELTGHFRFNIEFTSEDLYALGAAAARAPLEAKINELIIEIGELKRLSEN